jgi:preprotein translocase subunit SecE
MRRARPLEFLREVVAELKKVVWPTREETSRLTFIVLLVSIAVGIVLGIIDLGFTEVFSRFIFRGP